MSELLPAALSAGDDLFDANRHRAAPNVPSDRSDRTIATWTAPECEKKVTLTLADDRAPSFPVQGDRGVPRVPDRMTEITSGVRETVNYKTMFTSDGG
jgi:hypothetical protein